MAGASDEEILEGCDRVMQNIANLLFTRGLGLLTGKMWETGHFESKDCTSIDYRVLRGGHTRRAL